MSRSAFGPKQKALGAERGLLFNRSEYFSAAFEGGFKEAEAKEIYLEEDNPRALNLYVNSIYSNKTLCARDHSMVINGEDASDSGTTIDDDFTLDFTVIDDLFKPEPPASEKPPSLRQGQIQPS